MDRWMNREQKENGEGSYLKLYCSAVKSDLPTWKVYFNHLCGVQMVDSPAQQYTVPVIMERERESVCVP